MVAIHGRCFNKLDWLENLQVYESLKTTWVTSALDVFESVVRQASFPCLFGMKAVKSSNIELLFVSKESDVTDFMTGLASYLKKVNAWPLKCRVGKPLIVLLENNGFDSLEQEQLYAWDLLQRLHNQDPGPWPREISADLSSEKWSFSFMGIPLFVNMNFPRHRLMKSRNLGTHIVFVINPRENFDQVAAGNSLSGQRIRARIRSRSDAYNGGVYSRTLGVFGDPGNFEIKQYQLEEPGSLSHERCPFRMNID
ncbi:YqcI/YcgG family protein [Pseudomonas sp. HOU2]|uniref:YqcI/YcgG family protein n=1 Tax=Pseudomonas sp. HOU2 TaxID=3230301 RepID=UPI0034579A8F